MRRKLGGVNDRDYLAKCVVFIPSLEPEAEWPAAEPEVSSIQTRNPPVWPLSRKTPPGDAYGQKNWY